MVELKQYIHILWRWSWLIILGGILAGATAYVISRQAIPIYEASTTLLINQVPSGSAAPDYNSLLTSERLARTYGELLQKQPILQEVITDLNLKTDSVRLAQRINVSVARDTQLIVLVTEDTDPQRAADIANAIVRVFSKQNREMQLKRYTGTQQSLQQELLSVRSDLDRTQASLDALGNPTTPEQTNQQQQLQAQLDLNRSMYDTLLKNLGDIRLAETQMADNLSVVEPAQVNATPVRPRTLLNMLLASIIGALLATGMVLMLEYLDDSVKSSADVEKLIGAATLATVARISRSEFSNRLMAKRGVGSSIGEAYRMLRANIEFSEVANPIRTLVITSPEAFEGKSTTAANLAIAIAQTGTHVILVDTDLRRPTMHTLFQQPNNRGVTTALLEHNPDTVHTHLVSTGINNLRLMPSGPLPPNPAELLGWVRTTELIENLKTQADVVIFDTPPLLPVIDAALLARACDATLMVVLAGRTRAKALIQAKAQLMQSGTRFLGVVLNRAGKLDDYHYHSLRYGALAQQQLTRRFPFLRRSKNSPATPKVEPADFAKITRPIKIDSAVVQPTNPRESDVPSRSGATVRVDQK